MFNIGGMELLVILVVALLVLGPDKLPGFMRTAGRALGDLRRASADFQRTMNTQLRAGIPEEKRETAAEESPAASFPPQNATAPELASGSAMEERRKLARPRVSAGPRRSRRGAPPGLKGGGGSGSA